MPSSTPVQYPLIKEFGGQNLVTLAPVLSGFRVKAGDESTEEEYEALIDTGAGCSMIPEQIADELGVARIESGFTLSGPFSDGGTKYPFCFVKLVHSELGEAPISAAITPRRTILIGRDFLEAKNIVSDRSTGGPKRTLTLDYGLEQWSLV